MGRHPNREAGVADNEQAQAELQKIRDYERRENDRRFKRLMENEDFRVWFYAQVTQRGLLTAPAPRDRGGEALSRFEGRRDWAIELYNDALRVSPNTWSKVLAAAEQAIAKRNERMKQIEARAGVAQQPEPEEIDDA